MANLLEEYFLSPVLQNGWFNPVNTIAYSILLVIAVWIVYRLVIKMKIPIDSRLALALLPFIFWGSSTRVLHDSAVAGVLQNTIYESPFFVTPGSYFITFGLALGVLILSLLIQKFSKHPYWKPMFVIGFILCAWNVYMLRLPYLLPLALVVPMALFWTGISYLPKIIISKLNFPKKYMKQISRLFSKENMGILGSHYLDASATFFALSMFGYLEQHVVPRLLMPFMGPVSMFLLKTVVIFPVLYLIDRYSEDKSMNNFLKIVILILGLAPGLRDVIRMMAGV